MGKIFSSSSKSISANTRGNTMSPRKKTTKTAVVNPIVPKGPSKTRKT
jgi:hypothetical protein